MAIPKMDDRDAGFLGRRQRLLAAVAAGLPFGYLETADQNMYQLYAGVDPALWQDYEPLLWSKATLTDGTTYHAWTWISADGPEKVGPIIDWIRDRVPRDANGNPVVDPNNPSRYFIVEKIQWVFKGTASEPLKEALRQAGIPFTGG